MGNIATAVTVIATIVTTIATVVLAVLTYLYVRLTRQMVQSVESTREPFVDIEIDMPSGGLRFAFVNAGGTAARNIQVRVDKDCDLIKVNRSEAFGIASLYPIANGISYLPAGQRYLYYVGVLPHNLPPGEMSALRLTLTYHNDAGRSFERTVHYDLRELNEVMFESFGNTLVAVAESIRDAERSQHLHAHPNSTFTRMFTRACPHCHERISQGATKCPHCHERIEKADDSAKQDEQAPDASSQA